MRAAIAFHLRLSTSVNSPAFGELDEALGVRATFTRRCYILACGTIGAVSTACVMGVLQRPKCERLSRIWRGSRICTCRQAGDSVVKKI